MNALKLNSKDRFKLKLCPCGKSNKDGKFVPFEGHTMFGFCHSCVKKILPNNFSQSGDYFLKCADKSEIKIQHIPYHYMTKSIKRFKNNNFLNFIERKFGVEKANEAIELYNIGDSKNWFGATIFWQVDKNNVVRTGKIMLYNKKDGKRVKEPYDHINWVHSKLKIPNVNIDKCLFGEHLLNKFPDKTIAIVESEKTAVIASIFFPKFTWMATGGIANLSYDKLKALIGRTIIIFPDLCAFEKWLNIVETLQKWFNITISDYLEKNSSSLEKFNKLDLSDFLLTFNEAT